jgi:MFS family permease
MTINKKQISSLSILLFSKLFERIAFYMLISLLTQYLISKSNLEIDESVEFYSIFLAIITFTSFFSGLLGDLTNRIKLVKIGMLLMTILYFFLIFFSNSYHLFLAGLVLLGISLGINNSNIPVFVGNIFDERNTQIFGLTGFIFFSVVISVGALFAPLIAVYLKDNFGYNSVFILPFIFAAISYVLYLIFSKKYIRLDLPIENKKKFETEKKYQNLNLLIFLGVIFFGIFVRFVLQQKDLTFSFYVRDYVENGFNFKQNIVNLEKYISIILLIIFAIISIIIKINWSIIFKFIIVGTFLGLIGYAFAAILQTSENDKISQFPISIIFLILIISETIIYPTLSYIIYRSSPIRFKGLFQGISYTIVSSQLMFLGFMIYKNSNPNLTFLIFSIILLFCVILIYIFSVIIKKKEDKLVEIENM